MLSDSLGLDSECRVFGLLIRFDLDELGVGFKDDGFLRFLVKEIINARL